MSNLIRYDQARQALAACRSVDEVKDVRDKAEAMQLYAKQAQDTELEQMAAEIKFRAQRALGEMSATLPTQKGGFGIVPPSGKHKAEILAEAGISTSTANRYEKLAAIPEPVIEEIIAQSKDAGKPVSAKAVLAKVAPPRAKPQETGGSPSSIATPRDAAPAPGPVEVITPDAADEIVDDEHDDFVDKLAAQNEQLQRDLEKSNARIAELEALVSANDLANQVDMLTEKCARFDSLAASRFKQLSEVEVAINDHRSFLQALRKVAGLPKDGDLMAWVKHAAARAA